MDSKNLKNLIYIDLDDTVANFTNHSVFDNGFDVSHMYEPQFFLNLKPIDGALVGVRALIRMGYDVHILSQPVAESAHSYSEKVQWIGKHFPELINKIHLTQDKGLFKGDYLIDDNYPKWKDKFEANGGEFVHFDFIKNHKEEWRRIVEYLRSKIP